jgi:exopolyphosphatase / guanosine-5'-triphosphate,3'-diphosphate pyrophosphatase
MSELVSATVRAPRLPASALNDSRPCAAIDLGTNNCRLLIAQPGPQGMRVLEAYSRIVRLGHGLTRTGRLDEAAMERTIAALKVCAEKIRRRRVGRARAVATQACRIAANGREFVERIAAETGIRFKIITPREEARLSVAGCMALLDRDADAALVIDVGGGSTEFSWVDLKALQNAPGPLRMHPARLPIRAWLSIPYGVVSLTDAFPEQADRRAWFRAMVDAVKARLTAFHHADDLRPLFGGERAHLIGTSGAITSLAGLHLGLDRYDRNIIDGMWLSRDDCAAASDRLLEMDHAARAAQGCIGPERADLVVAGAAILQAAQELWPCARVRVADRGLREGLLMSLMNERPQGRGAKKRRRKRNGGSQGRKQGDGA